ncbi:hypothetical protein T10_10543 [Trichinella papuae]|uniref:Uncharacterized protein n=1 Tax=Trichinella papuae TaxID=268474 RepID=A0A0V1M545_9BILA|nr:hypothetical protein T10_10543 [Trichinella papuae]
MLLLNASHSGRSKQTFRDVLSIYIFKKKYQRSKTQQYSIHLKLHNLPSVLKFQVKYDQLERMKEKLKHQCRRTPAVRFIYGRMPRCLVKGSQDIYDDA